MKQSVCCWKPWMNWKWPSTTRLYGQIATISSSILSPRSSWTHQRFVELPAFGSLILWQVTSCFVNFATFLTYFRLRNLCVPWWCVMAAVCGSCGCCRLSWKSTSAWLQLASKSPSASFWPMNQATTWTSACTRRSLIPERDRWGPKINRWGT